MQHVEATGWNPYGSLAARDGVPLSDVFPRAGLVTPGFLWRVDRFVSLPRLQQKYADSWRATNKDLTKTPQETVRRATTHLLFEIISALASQGEKQVADAVLKSTSDYLWLQSRGSLDDEAVESVDEFHDGLGVENRKGMFYFDPNLDGRHHQCWIIDQVMEKGGFWVGRLMEDDLAQLGTDKEPMFSGSESGGSDAMGTQANPDSVDRRGSLPVATSRDSDGQDAQHRPAMNEKHGKNLFLYYVKMQMARAGVLRDLSAMPKGLWEHMMTRAALLTQFMFDVSRKDDINVEEMACRRAIFDLEGSNRVEGGCMVLNLHQMLLESLPRPGQRAMSVSWVVEPTEKRAGAEDVADHPAVKKIFCTRQMVRGMWRHSLVPSGWYHLD